MVNCQDILEFQGVWRDYQQRVLNQLDIYKKDHKIHIVAAPGSGKTTLGIEIIRRVNKPALILVPTITIRQQWVTRIKEAFLKAGLKSEEYISQDLKHLRLINVSTYQSIHSAMRKVKDQEDEENVDYQDFSLIEAIKEAGIETLCLDECHHLRTEWWKALEDFKKQITTVFTISLTATPPYDSSIAMWTRYLDMCGDIDIEITVPELVKEGSLCPHQDYVYFNYPTAKEEAKMKEFQDDVQNVFSFFMHHQKFQQAILSHPYVRSIQDLDKALENPAYLSSLLIYLESQQLSYPREYLKILGTKKLEKMSIKWMEILLQGFFFDDRDSYIINEEDFEELYKYVFIVRCEKQYKYQPSQSYVVHERRIAERHLCACIPYGRPCYQYRPSYVVEPCQYAFGTYCEYGAHYSRKYNLNQSEYDCEPEHLHIVEKEGPRLFGHTENIRKLSSEKCPAQQRHYYGTESQPCHELCITFIFRKFITCYYSGNKQKQPVAYVSQAETEKEHVERGEICRQIMFSVSGKHIQLSDWFKKF